MTDEIRKVSLKKLQARDRNLPIKQIKNPQLRVFNLKDYISSPLPDAGVFRKFINDI